MGGCAIGGCKGFVAVTTYSAEREMPASVCTRSVLVQYIISRHFTSDKVSGTFVPLAAEAGDATGTYYNGT